MLICKFEAGEQHTSENYPYGDGFRGVDRSMVVYPPCTQEQ